MIASKAGEGEQKKNGYLQMYLIIKLLYAEYQFVHPSPKGNELIISAPFRAGVFRENQ